MPGRSSENDMSTNAPTSTGPNVLVFAAVPYGVVGALSALSIMHTPFGFMAFLGIVSLIGVIVSHVIVLFDFIEEMHEKGSRSSRPFRTQASSVFGP
jgi:multidrug efflux pump subunit AcrB